jgi:hypothetical protein
MSISGTFHNLMVQTTLGGIAGTTIETFLDPAPAQVTDENAARVLLQILLQLGFNGIFGTSYFEFVGRKNSVTLRNDPTKGILLNLVLVATQPNLLRKLSLTGRYFASLLRATLPAPAPHEVAASNSSSPPNSPIPPSNFAPSDSE